MAGSIRWPERIPPSQSPPLGCTKPLVDCHAKSLRRILHAWKKGAFKKTNLHHFEDNNEGNIFYQHKNHFIYLQINIFFKFVSLQFLLRRCYFYAHEHTIKTVICRAMLSFCLLLPILFLWVTQCHAQYGQYCYSNKDCPPGYRCRPSVGGYKTCQPRRTSFPQNNPVKFIDRNLWASF